MRFAARLAVVVALFGATAAIADAATDQNGTVALHRGIEFLYGGDLHGARREVNQSLKLQPNAALSHAVLGRVYLELGDGAAAESELRIAVDAGLAEVRVQHLLLHAYLLQNDAQRVLDDAGAIGPSANAQSYAHRVRARAAASLGDFARASAEFDKAGALTPNSSLLWSDVGRFRLNAGNVAGAQEAGQRAVTLNAKNPDALMLMGELVRGQYGLTAAIPWFQKILDIDPNHLGALLESAATLGDAGQAKAMLALTRQVLQLDPDNARAYYLQAVMAARAGNAELARGLLYRIEGKLDKLPGAMLLQAVLDMNAGGSEQAIAKLQDLIKLQPENLKVRRLLGAAMWRAGDHKSAITVLEPVAQRGDADSYTLSIIGRAYEKDGNREAAATYLDRAAEPMRGEPVPFEMSRDLIALASTQANANDANIAIPRITLMLASGQKDEALALARQLAERNPGAPAAFVLVGDALMAKDQPSDAATAYAKAANITFSESTALRYIEALRRSDKEGEALHVLDLFLSQNPRSVAGLLLASDHFLTTGQWDRAIAILQGLRFRIGDRDATILNSLGWAWFNKGDAIKAANFAAAAYAIAPTNPALANSYGWILFKTGKDKVGGIALLQKAVAIAPNHPGLRFQLAQALVATGRGDEAKPHLLVAVAAAGFAQHSQAAALLAGL